MIINPYLLLILFLLVCILIDEIVKHKKQCAKAKITWNETNTPRNGGIYIPPGRFTSCVKPSEDVAFLEPNQHPVVLVPIIIKISAINGRYYYPDFDKIPAGLRDNQSWRRSPGGLGAQWMLSPPGPNGTIYGALKIPEPAAQAAAALLPNDVKILTETEWEEMCDTHKNKRHYE